MAELLIVSGPPGVGKSTVARAIAIRLDRSVVVPGDAFFEFLGDDLIPPWLPESDPQNEAVTEAAGAAAGTFARRGYTTVYDGVLGPWFLDRFVAAAGVVTVDYVVLLPPLEQTLERIRSRVDHPFGNEQAATRLHAQWTEAELDARHALDNGDLDLDATVAAILAGQADGRWTVGPDGQGRRRPAR